MFERVILTHQRMVFGVKTGLFLQIGVLLNLAAYLGEMRVRFCAKSGAGGAFFCGACGV